VIFTSRDSGSCCSSETNRVVAMYRPSVSSSVNDDTQLDIQLDEESDSCGELPLSSTSCIQHSTVDGFLSGGQGGGQGPSNAMPETVVVHRRSSEYYPAGRQQTTGIASFGRQARRDRRLSDPGRLAVPLLRLNLHQHQATSELPSNGGGSPQPGGRLSDPRLAAIRSLFASGPCEVGEALAPPSPEQTTTSTRSPRSRSPTSPSDLTAQLHQHRLARLDTRRLSLPNPQPLQSFGGASKSPLTTWLLPNEVNEAMGAVSGSLPLSSSPPLTRTGQFSSASAVSGAAGSPSSPVKLSSSLPSGSLSFSSSSTSSSLRRRRSVSLDQSGGNGGMRLEAITEENHGVGGGAKTLHGDIIASGISSVRKCSMPHTTLLCDLQH